MTAGLSGRLAALLVAAVILVVAGLGWFALVAPQRSKAADVQAQVDDTRIELASTQAYASDPANRRQVRTLRRLEGMLPVDVRMPQVIRQLAAASATSGVRIDGITPAPAVPSAGGQATPISVAVTGEYFGIARFLQTLRSKVQIHGTSVTGSGRLYSVDGVQFQSGASQGGESSDANALTATIAMNVFAFGGSPSGGTATSPAVPAP